MEKEALKILEYGKITAMLAERAGSILGKERAEALRPSSDLAEVQDWMAQTREAYDIMAMTRPPLGGIRDIRSILKKTKLGAVLSLDDIMAVMSSLYAMRNVKKFFKELEMEVPVLKGWAHDIEIMGQLERNLDNAVDEHGNLRDDASMELRRIRHELKSSQRHIKERLSAVLHDAGNQKCFQDLIVTIRDERYVLPVKQEYRAHFPGIVHDQSASGSTLFIEPMAIVELNNDVKQLTMAEQHEIERILRSLSEQIGRSQEPLLANSDILADIDFAFAKAKLAKDMDAIEPLLNDEGRTRIFSARHPLIAPAKVVPIDIALGGEYTMLLITGPNTGGKTVSMKTLGLLVLMAQSGCFLPAGLDSEVAVYQNVYADIGDEQSIEQSLSTFSAHMTHIVSILQKVEPDDLLLLDELGAGTDPEEGAALAMAILEQLLAAGAGTVATTHYSELKTFAYTHDGIENACVEFDVKTLRPTYRLLVGIPGASNAFAISRRLGLGDSVILRAQQLIKADHAQFENVLNQLESEKMMYEQRNADIQERVRHAEQVERKAETVKKELSEQKAKILRKAKDDSASLVRRTRRESEAIIKQLKEQFNDYGIKKRQQVMQDARKTLKEAAGRTRPILSGRAYDKPVDLQELQPGDTVYVAKLDQKGVVLSIQGRELEVQLGSLRMNIKAKDCRFVSHQAKEKTAHGGNRRRQSASFLTKTANVRREIDIRGLMVDEAEQVLGKFLDDAAMAGLSQVLVIHGKGTGALRKGVHQYLKQHKGVLDFAFAGLDEGGTGATVVELK
jgi:DNA mismatch repair protein MutS2